MDPAKIVLLGVKGTVLAFNQETGERLWTQPLKAGLAEHFVTVIADTKRVYAHTKGEIFCLDLLTGQILWQDGLNKLGYGIASLAIPGQPVSPTAIMAALQQQHQAASSATTSASH